MEQRFCSRGLPELCTFYYLNKTALTQSSSVILNCIQVESVLLILVICNYTINFKLIHSLICSYVATMFIEAWTLHEQVLSQTINLDTRKYQRSPKKKKKEARTLNNVPPRTSTVIVLNISNSSPMIRVQPTFVVRHNITL